MHAENKNKLAPFGERLIAVEPLSSEVQQRLQKELHSMFIRQLGLPHRMFLGLVAVASTASAFVCGFLAATEADLPPIARIGLGTGVLFGIAWTVVAARVCWRGAMDLKIDGNRIAGMVWVFTVLMMVFFLMVGMSVHDRMLGLMMIANGLAFLIGAGVFWLTHRIESAALGTREKLLELELRIAELSERR
jgi:hypothetical protein